MFSIQRMNMEHAHFLFEWRNDEVTRTNSFSSEKIEWEAHVSWIERKAKEPEHHLIFFSGSMGILLSILAVQGVCYGNGIVLTDGQS